MTIKVLESTYQPWIDLDKKLARLKGGAYRHVEELRDYHNNIAPVFNRPGLYYDSAKQLVWEEVLIDGKIEAFTGTSSARQFKYDLYKLDLEERPYSLHQLRELIKLDKQSTIRVSVDPDWLSDLLMFRQQTRQLATDKYRMRKRLHIARGKHANRQTTIPG